MSEARILGLIFAIMLICGVEKTESTTSEAEQDQDNENTPTGFSFEIPLGGENVIYSDSSVPQAQRRLSLEDFFVNSNNNNNNRQEPQIPEVQLPEPAAQFQVQQPDPNSVLFTRDTQFPSPSGGMLSRLLLARRMVRLRRMARRLSLIPRLVGLGMTLRRAQVPSNLSPLSIFSNRIGEGYNPRDYVFGNKAFSYQNNLTADNNGANFDQMTEQTTRYPVEAQPYYDSHNEDDYNLDNSNGRGSDSHESNDLNLQKHQNVLNSLTDEQQVYLLQQLQNYQQQLNQLQQHLNSQPYSNDIQQNYQDQGHANDVQKHQPQQNAHKVQPNQYQQEDRIILAQQNYQQQQPQQNVQKLNEYHQQDQRILAQQNYQQQPQSNNDQELEQMRQLQTQLLREQQLQQLQQMQLNQQSQNLKQYQNLASSEQEQSYKNQNNQQQLINQQNLQHQEINTVGDRTEASGYLSPLGTGNVAGGGAGKTIGVGLNIGIKPPAVDIQVTNPTGIKTLSGPVSSNLVQGKLFPLSIFPKPILNLQGRLFFGAEAGKNAGFKSKAGN